MVYIHNIFIIIYVYFYLIDKNIIIAHQYILIIYFNKWLRF